MSTYLAFRGQSVHHIHRFRRPIMAILRRSSPFSAPRSALGRASSFRRSPKSALGRVIRLPSACAREMPPAKCCNQWTLATVSEVIWNYLKISKCIYLYCHLMLCACWIRVCPDVPARTADVAKRFRSKGSASSARASLREACLIPTD